MLTPTPIVPFPDLMNAAMTDIPSWSSAFPLTGPIGEGKNVEMAWNKVFPTMALSPYQQGKLGTCVPISKGHALEMTLLNQIAKGDKSTPWSKMSVEWIYGVSRRQMPGPPYPNPQGCSPADATRCVKHYGVIAAANYKEANMTVYNPDRAMAWGDSGAPDWSISKPKYYPKTTVKITNIAELVSAINADICLTGYGHWVFWNTDLKGIITGPDVSPLTLKPGESSLKMWGHEMPWIGYRVIGGKIYIGVRNMARPANHRGGQDKLFPYRGTGLIAADDPIIKTVFEKFAVIAFVSVQKTK